ncbi:MAG: AAA family ATPase [Candidatus Korarchaeota archaeon]|nr:AAA family ATPase [Candidatus Korarchaeota archaeon]NIU82868.1 AAA family ATPase [Candidatus Thorarchaeota archaeon]NIW12562.1 AAA family ATPase [Candidatus Thorarchaeota archaeon]NIW50782.1 AAA family ATPase [Candidatus Korarchaeota archaeon]
MLSSKILENPETLEHRFIPPTLPTREQELSQLQERILTNFKETRSFDGIVLYGGVGTGKTHLAKRVALNVQETVGNLVSAYTNCRFNRRTYKTLTNIVGKVEKSIPKHGLARDELIRILVRLIKQKSKKAILIFDEIDALFWGEEKKKAEDMLYSLSRLPEGLDLQGVSYTVIVISREVELYTSLDKPTRASFIQKELKLPTYGKEDMSNILNYRAELAFKPNSISATSINQIASHVAENASGNARVGIDILREAGKLVERGRGTRVTSSIVRNVIGRHPTLPGIDYEMLVGLGKQKLLLLLGIIRGLKSGENDFITRKEASNYYRLASENYGEEPRKTTQVYRYLNELNEKLPILNTSVTGKGRVGRSTQIWVSVPLEQLEQKIEGILEET